MLDEIGIVGISWRQVGSEALAGYSLPEDARDAGLASFARSHGLAEVAYIETCNRVEVVFADAVGTPARDLRAAVLELLAGSSRERPSAPCGPGGAKAPASTCSWSRPASTRRRLGRSRSRAKYALPTTVPVHRVCAVPDSRCCSRKRAASPPPCEPRRASAKDPCPWPRWRWDTFAEDWREHQGPSP